MKGWTIWSATLLICAFSTVRGQTLITIPDQITRVEENAADVVLFTGNFTQNKPNCDLQTLLISDPSIFELTSSLPVDNSLTFNITLIQPLDYEQTKRVTVQLSSSWNCGNVNEVVSIGTLMIFVDDLRDTPPIFSQTVYSANVPENQPVNTVVVKNITAKDVDTRDSFMFSVNFEAYQESLFNYQVDTTFTYLDILLLSPLDYEQQQMHEFIVIANDTAGMASSSQVVINVINVQDSPPVFSALLYNGRVKEADPPGTVVLKVSAVDGDSMVFQDQGSESIENQINFSITEGAFGMFDINITTGEIFTVGTLDIDTNPDVVNGLVIMTVKATEQNTSGQPQYGETETTVQVQIQIEDANDNRPQFNAESYSGSIRADALQGELITIQRGDYISVVDIDVSPSNNHFSIAIEKDGEPWDMFSSNIDSQYGQASLLLQLNKDGGLLDMAESHVTFQIVAQEISSSNETFPPVKVNMVLWVVAQSTPAPPAEPVINLPLTTADIFVFIVGALLLLNFILTIIICYVLRGGRQPSFFKRNDKYYVSERKKRDAENAANAEASASRGTNRANLSKNDPVTTEITVNEGKQTAGLGVNAGGTVDTVAAIANRNRCDLTPMPNERGSHSDTADSKTTRTQAGSQGALLNLLEGSDKGNTCDVTPLTTTGADNIGQDKGDPKKIQSKNLTGQNQNLSHLLQRVQEKLGQGRKQEINDYQDACDLRPLQTKATDKHFTDISLDSSFSESSTADVKPLIKSSQMNDKDDQLVYQNSRFDAKDSNKDKATPDGKNNQTSKNMTVVTSSGLSPVSNIKPVTASSTNQKLKDKQSSGTKSIPANTQPASYQKLYRPTAQMTQTNVPPIALALPTHAPTGPERMDPYRGIINPVFSSSDEQPESSRKPKTTPAPVPALVAASQSHKTAFSKPSPKTTTSKQDLAPVKMPQTLKADDQALKTSGLQDQASKDVPLPQESGSSKTDADIKPPQSQISQVTPNLPDTSKETSKTQDYVTAAKHLLSTVASSPRLKQRATEKTEPSTPAKSSEEKLSSTPKTETMIAANPKPITGNGPTGSNEEKLTSF